MRLIDIIPKGVTLTVFIVSRAEATTPSNFEPRRKYEFRTEEGKIGEYMAAAKTDSWLSTTKGDEAILATRKVYNGHPYPELKLASDISAKDD